MWGSKTDPGRSFKDLGVVRAEWFVLKDNRVRIAVFSEKDLYTVLRKLGSYPYGCACFQRSSDDNEFMCIVLGRIVEIKLVAGSEGSSHVVMQEGGGA